MTNPLVLSTKKLRFHQLERLMAAQCDVVDYDALQIEIQPFSIPKKPNYCDKTIWRRTSCLWYDDNTISEVKLLNDAKQLSSWCSKLSRLHQRQQSK